MSDELTALPSRQRLLVRAALAVVVFAAAGALDGLLWRHLWSPVTGVVQQHQWYATPFYSGERHDFDGVAWYVVVALVSGIVVGAVAVLTLRGHELITLAAVALGSVAAGLVMWRVGMLGNGGDPTQLAKHLADGTKLTSTLHLGNAVPLVAYPLGALGTLMSVFLLTARHDDTQPVEEPALEPVSGG